MYNGLLSFTRSDIDRFPWRSWQGLDCPQGSPEDPPAADLQESERLWGNSSCIDSFSSL